MENGPVWTDADTWIARLDIVGSVGLTRVSASCTVLALDSDRSDRGNTMGKVLIDAQDALFGGNDLLQLLDMVDSERLRNKIEPRAHRLIAAGSPETATTFIRRSVWIVATENEEALPDAWVFSTRDAAIEWLVEQVRSWASTDIMVDDTMLVYDLAQAGTPDDRWNVIADYSDQFNWPAMALWERVIDGGGSLPL